MILSDLMFLFFWIYWNYIKIFGTILIILTLLYKFSKVGTKFNYAICFVTLCYSLQFAAGLGLPFVLLYPRKPTTCNILCWFLRKVSYLLDFTWEVRGYENVKKTYNNGGILLMNHQSLLDMFGIFI